MDRQFIIIKNSVVFLVFVFIILSFMQVIKIENTTHMIQT